MASSSTIQSMVLSKGDRVSVEVEDVSGAIISVRMVNGDRSYRGILLQEVTCAVNSYGVNPERVCSAPYWPSITNSANGINLKTIPCSIERYSYKVEGQASNLNVFQPDPSKRSHRHQPAPQLSRILRPRRFVCRKCKKAYHVEEHGAELSSSQLDQCLSDSSSAQLLSDSDVKNSVQLNSHHLTSGQNHSQSIRHVTPSIIPKLNENYALMNQDSESEGQTVTTTQTTAKCKKKAEQSTKTHDKLESKPLPPEPAVSVTASTPMLPKKRKAAETATNALQKPKKVRLAEFSKVVADSSSTNDCQSCLSVAESTYLGNTISTTGSATPEVVTVSTLKSSPTLTSPLMVNVRKNRIKEQYGSLSSPFCFPFGKKCKMNLKKSVKLEGKSISESSKSDERLPNNTSNINSVQKSSGNSQRRSNSRPPTNSRHRNRTRANPISTLPPTSATSPTSVQDVVANSDQVSESQTDSKGAFVKGDEMNNTNHSSQCSVNNDMVQEEKTKDDDLADNALQSSSALHKDKGGSSATTSPSKFSNLTCSHPGVPNVQSDSNQSASSRRRALDYEKPKNRWMREARARRPQEERIASSQNTQVLPNNSSSASSSSSNHDLDLVPTTHAVDNPTSSRLRIRSGDMSVSSISSTKGTSTSNSTKSKSSGSVQSNVVIDASASGIPGEIEPLTLTDLMSVSNPHVPSPSVTSLENHSPSLPVIKIKIKPFGSSKTSSSAQYEVVNLQMSDCTASTDADPKAKSETRNSVDETFEHETAHNGQFRSPSPSLSNASTRRDGTPMGSPHFGPFVKRCRLPGGIVFRVGDLVWSKLSGWPYWPAQITSIQRTESEPVIQDAESGLDDTNFKSASPTPCSKQVYTACLHWFACNQVSYMACDKLFHFLQHYKRFDNKKKRGQFRQAVNEARHQAEIKQQSAHSQSDDNETDGTEVSSPEDDCEDDGANKPIQEITNETVESPSDADKAPDQMQITSTMQPGADVNVQSSSSESLVVTTVDTSLTSNNTEPVKLQSDRRNTKKNKSNVRGKRTKRSSSFPNSQDNISTPDVQKFEPYSFEDNEDTYIPNTSMPNRSQRNRKSESKSLPNSLSVMTEPVKSNIPPEQRGSLKIFLSTSKPRTNAAKTGSKFKSTKKRNKQNSKSTISDQRLMEPTLAVTQSSSSRLPHLISPVEAKLDAPVPDYDNFGPVNQSSESQPYSQNSYDNPPSELISQFPHVFPDLKATGLLSDTVDIPTFSEDESEEEDAGRLIIDPESISSSSISSNSHFMNPDFAKSESFIPREEMYSVHSNTSTLHHPSSLTDSTPSSSSNSSNFLSGSRFSADMTRQSFPTVSSYHMSSVLPESSSVPMCSINSAAMDSRDHQHIHNLLGPHGSTSLIGTNKSIYYQPSHHRVPSTTAAHNVPYLATEYTNLW